MVAGNYVGLTQIQESWNYFNNDFSNHVTLQTGLVGFKFKQATNVINVKFSFLFEI